MSVFRNRAIVAAVVGALTLSPILPAPSAGAAPSAGKVFTVKATVKGAPGQTLVLMAKSGRVLASSKITGQSKAVTLKTPKIKALTGASLHLIGAGGDYFGPVVLSWTGAKSAKATKVSTTMTSASTTASLGVINVTTKTTNQGSGIVVKKYAKSAKPTTRALGGVPVGVGNYGKSIVEGASTRGVRALGVSYSAGNVAPGADADSDGIMNAFDVNDDGDAKLDFQDTDRKPQPGAADLAADCSANVSFAMFSNFKATQPDFSGTINAYGASVGGSAANGTAIRTALKGTLSFAIQRVSGNVCGETVSKNEFKGINVAYAPSDWVVLPNGGQDVQWAVGDGKMNGQSVPGLNGFDFTDTSKCAPGCISGQDTFVQRVTTSSGKTYEFVVNPGFIFVTHPMLAEINGTPVNYAASPIVGSGNGAGPVSIPENGAVSIEIYRPQRFAIDGESGDYYDIAGLEYYPDIPNPIDTNSGANGNQGSGPSAGRCDGAKVTDGEMTTDTPVNTATPPVFTITWEMSKIQDCFTTKGANWVSGVLDIDIQVVAPVPNSGNAAQKIYFSLTVN